MPHRRATWIIVTVMIVALAPAVAWAQAAIAGLVRDSSGAVLPGVTVEASSDVLIEKVRTAVTDGSGRYQIVDLRAGTYAVTFTLPGFSSVKREGIELTGLMTATVSADLRVGAVQETITVTGESPMVDVQSVRRQATITGEVLSTIPTARGYTGVMLLVPAIQTQGSSPANVQATPGMVVFGTPGGRNGNEGRLQVDGLGVGAARNGGGVSGYNADIANAQEISFTVSAGLGEAEVSGPSLSVVPKTGGNSFRGSVFLAGVSEGMVGSNYTPELEAAGLGAPGRLLQLWDFTAGLGGPIKKDRLWYFLNLRNQGSHSSVSGMFANQNAGDPTKWTYLKDETRQSRTAGSWTVASLRLTLQATPRNKFNIYWDEQKPCTGATYSANDDGCRTQPSEGGFVYGGSPTAAPETATYENRFQRVQQLTWNSPVTNRVLLTAGFGDYLTRWGGDEMPGNLTRSLVRVTEQCAPNCPLNGGIPNLTYRSANWASHWMGQHNWNASMTYVTGAHNLKFGYQGTFYADDEQYYTNDEKVAYRLNNGTPNLITLTLHSNLRKLRTRYHAVYAQEQWTMGRMTLQGAIRFDHAWSYSPEQIVGPTRFLPTPIIFAETAGVVGYNDISPRLGLAYDLFGNGKTAVKVNLGRYLDAASNNNGNYSITNPTSRMAGSTEAGRPPVTRSWTDGNLNFIPDCNLSNPDAQNNLAAGGDSCGAISDRNFGTATLSRNFDPAALEGWGVRPADWEFGVSVQQEVLPRVSVELGYFRRWLDNFFVDDNLATVPADFTPFGITAPVDDRLPGGGGYPITGLYDVVPAKFGQVNDYFTKAESFGEWYQHYNGFLLNVTARPRNGLTMQGGLLTGKTVRDLCGIRDVNPELTYVTPANASGPGNVYASPVFPYCHTSTGFTTRVTGLATYTVPKIDVLVSGTFRSEQGAPLAANFTVTNAMVAAQLGRNLSAPGGSVVVNLIEPGTMYGDRLNEVDFRIAKLLRFGRTRTNVGVDIYNLFNANPALTYNAAFSTALPFPRPTGVLTPRFAKISAQIDF
jgi:Carboxypeptidase regulatory-like domain